MVQEDKRRMTNNLPENDDAPWLNLTQEEINQLRYNKQKLTDYGKQKIRALMLKSQMTEIDISKVLIEGDTATIMGVKYQRIIEPHSFNNKLWGLLRTKIDNPVECSETTDRVLDLIRENIPEPYENLKFGVSEWFLGYNEAIKRVNERLFNGIQ